MGGQPSTRRMTLVDDKANGVIIISDSVRNRLKHELGCRSTQQQMQDKQTNVSTSEAPQPSPPAKVIHDTMPQVSAFHNDEGQSLTSLKVLAEKEQELKDLENYWTKRMEALEQDKTTFVSVRSLAV